MLDVRQRDAPFGIVRVGCDPAAHRVGLEARTTEAALLAQLHRRERLGRAHPAICAPVPIADDGEAHLDLADSRSARELANGLARPQRAGEPDLALRLEQLEIGRV